MKRLLILGCLTGWWFTQVTLAGGPERFFDRKVAPILTRRCLGCHNEQLKNGNVSFLDRTSLVNGGSHGPAIVPGKPGQSLLIRTLQHDGEIQMPPGKKLPKREIAILAEWVRRGAPWGNRLRTSAP